MEYQTELKDYNDTAHIRFSKQITELLKLKHGMVATVKIEEKKVIVEIERDQNVED